MRPSLTQPLVLLLLLLGILYLILQQLQNAALIFAVVVVVVGIETGTRLRANRAIDSLGELSAPVALVWRDGALRTVPPDDLVIDDVIMLSTGSRVPADARIIESEKLMLDESLVTGESQPVELGTAMESGSEVRAGTHVVRGRGVAVVTAVGRDSTLGRITSMVENSTPQSTPLQDQMGRLARELLAVAIPACALVTVVGVVRGQPLRDMLLGGLALAFATIPQELPVLVVVILGLGSLRLARHGAIVRHLSAAETLGTMTLICTDKTGTLTENRIALTAVATSAEIVEEQPAKEADLGRLRRFAQLASEPPARGGDGRLADPVDTAVWQGATWEGPEPIARFGFDDTRRLSSAITEVEGYLVLGVKGGPEAVVVRSTDYRSQDGSIEPMDGLLKTKVIAAAQELASTGARVLGVGSRTIQGPPVGGPSLLECDLVFEGLLAFADPLRSEVPGAVRELLRANVGVTMVTGDQPTTAESIARAAGLGGSVFLASQTKGWSDEELAARAYQGCVVARARAEDKLHIVRAAESVGHIVAVTGDGVNDAPALRAAAIGVAMGMTGSDVARETADLVLRDDSFATLVRATGVARGLYENLRKAVRYYLSIKLGLIAISLVMALSGRPLPFSPVQIVLIGLFMDIGASISFVNLPPEDDQMRKRPRDPRARLLNRAMLLGILGGGLTLALLTGFAFQFGAEFYGVGGGRTLALVAWLMGGASL
ncbi:MAG: cation-transporting P-type ATPase, partial [Candidatus Dormibacteraeota bacterium]|nr:cation-transporting P-type ATPase [Candidatus Dormibacteraeota bacterium]